MKYIPLSSLQNSYSSVSRYRGEANSVSIDGFYPENSLNIPVENIDSLGVISGTSFRFIIKINEGGLYTSDSFYNDLVRAKQSKNPYFVNTALNPKSFVNISIAQLRQTFNTRTQQESPFAVTCIFNNLFDGNGSVNYQRFGEYIDWVVSKPKLNDVIDNGILNSNRISQFNVSPTFDYQVPEIRNYGGSTPPSNGGGTSTGGGSNSGGGNTSGGGGTSTGGGGTSTGGGGTSTGGGTDDTRGGGNESIGGSGANIGESTKTTITVDGEEFEINLLPGGLAGGGPVGGEGEQGNLPPGGNQGNRNPLNNPGGNPEEDIANEYTIRYRNTNREL